MEKFFIFIVAISILNGVNTLQCYQCTNCASVQSDHIVTCGSNTTTTTTAAPNTSSTTTTTTTTTTPSTPTQNTTSSTTTTTTPSTPTQNTTSSTTTTTTPSTPTQNTTSSTTTTTTSTTTTTTTTTPSTPTQNTTNTTAPEVIRLRRSVNEENNCFCADGVCNCNGLKIVQFSSAKAEETYVCVTDTLIVNGTATINRGCAVKHNATQQTCIMSSYSMNCTVCETDKCNDATSIHLSALLFVGSFFIAFKMY